MNVRVLSTHALIKVSLSSGEPSSPDFFRKAWASEPLTGLLKETDIGYALPLADPDLSVVAKNEEGDVIGHCATNKVVKYWDHITNLHADAQNLSTQTFVKIQKKAVQDEIEYLTQIDLAKDQSFHSAGIAVLPECRGQNIGLRLRSEQIATCKKINGTTLFCETTNLFSAATVKKTNFDQVASYPYKDLAVELSHPELATLDDSFSVWCLKI